MDEKGARERGKEGKRSEKKLENVETQRPTFHYSVIRPSALFSFPFARFVSAGKRINQKSSARVVYRNAPIYHNIPSARDKIFTNLPSHDVNVLLAFLLFCRFFDANSHVIPYPKNSRAFARYECTRVLYDRALYSSQLYAVNRNIVC